MTNQQNHPITPPPELVEQWWTEFERADFDTDSLVFVATQAARWGADQELEACCADIHTVHGKGQADWLRSMRRPKPPSLKDQALAVLERSCFVNPKDGNIIRLALEQLSND